MFFTVDYNHMSRLWVLGLSTWLCQATTLGATQPTKIMPNQITVTDQNGNSHPVLAAKRISSFRSVVVSHWHSQYSPFVVHTFNEADGGFHFGHYCATLADAFAVFAEYTAK